LKEPFRIDYLILSYMISGASTRLRVTTDAKPNQQMRITQELVCEIKTGEKILKIEGRRRKTLG